MKITCHTTGIFADAAIQEGLPLFLEQYREKFPGLSYLHLELGGAIADPGQEPWHYYGDGRCLKIQLTKGNRTQLPSPFEIYTELRAVFDRAVEIHLQSHLEDAVQALAGNVKEKTYNMGLS